MLIGTYPPDGQSASVRAEALTNIHRGYIHVEYYGGAMKVEKETPSLSDFARPSVAVDLVLLTIDAGRLSVLAIRRDDAVSEAWALPGGFVHIQESLDDTVSRLLREKARLPDAFVEQLYTFGRPDRDPRGRVISVAYYALVHAERLRGCLEGSRNLALGQVRLSANQKCASVLLSDGTMERLAFDHDEILATAVRRLRGKLDYSAVGLELLPKLFTLRQLQEVHEAILGEPLAKPAFRRKILDRGWLKATGKLETGAAFRPAELYRRAG
ncbi:NUDIX domain-containing protein [Reyranella sp.]|jgi:8-oxo-dGTP diphosphatase|uniref:NUDIX hydrolase n=1 Tax=Reyranella sp. TaxID=1929291 RepID=UPI0026C6D161|nr:NUDIX domain-containing protein [Reyranella sp.]